MATKADATAKSRQAILEAAAGHFSRRGFRGTPLAAIADTAGMTQTGVLYHFGSKENLLIEVLNEKIRRDAVFGADLGTRDAIGAVQAVVDMARADKELAGMSALFSALLVDALDSESSIHEMMVTRYRAGRHIISNQLRSGQADGTLDPTFDPDMKAAEMLAVLDGIRGQWLLDPETIDPVAIATQYVAHQLAALMLVRGRRRGAART